MLYHNDPKAHLPIGRLCQRSGKWPQSSRRTCQNRCPALTVPGGPMRIDPAILGVGGRSAALVWRLARDFMRPHVRRILFAFLLMGLAAGSTAGRAWLVGAGAGPVLLSRGGFPSRLVRGG